jgi:hypothetical protein
MQASLLSIGLQLLWANLGDFFGENSVFRQKPATFVRVSVDCPPFFSNLLLFCIQISSGGGARFVSSELDGY